MAEDKQELKVPEAPALLPEKEQAEWSKKYQAARQESFEMDKDAHPSVHEANALRAANGLLKVPKITSLEQAMKMPKWQFIAHAVEDKLRGLVKFVTIDGKKYAFEKSGKAAA